MLSSSASASARRARSSSSSRRSTSATNRGWSTRSMRRLPLGIASTLMRCFPPCDPGTFATRLPPVPRRPERSSPSCLLTERVCSPKPPLRCTKPPRVSGPRTTFDPDRPRLASRSIVTASPRDSYCRNPKRSAELPDAQIVREARIAGSGRLLTGKPLRAKRQFDHSGRDFAGEDPGPGGHPPAHVRERDRPEVRMPGDTADLAGTPAGLGDETGPGCRRPDAGVLEAEPGQAPLHLSQVVDPCDRFLARVAALVEVHVRAEQPGLLGD